MNCNGATCGTGTCDVCVHMMQRIENMEAGRDELFKPIVAHIPFKLIVPEGMSLVDPVAQICDAPPAPHGLDVGVPGDEERGDSVSAVWEQTFDGVTAGSAGVPILHDAGAGSVGAVPVDAGCVE